MELNSENCNLDLIETIHWQ